MGLAVSCLNFVETSKFESKILVRESDRKNAKK